jgi:soluble lytic murein transglycosylase-like protein
MKFKIKTLACIAALLAPCTVSANIKPKRTVVLLDFTSVQMPAAATAETLESAPDVDALSRMIARQFTGAPDHTPPLDMAFAPAMISSGPNLSVLGNPFARHDVGIRRALPNVPTMQSLGAQECLLPEYRPSSGFGRQAEERRRIIFPLVHRAACEAGLPVGLFDALVMQESRYQPAVSSPVGAFGLAQLMPGTARQLGVDRYSLSENLRGGARYLKEQLNQFGRYDLALAAYNAGPNRQSLREGRVPKIPETQHYVRTILANWSGVAPTPAPRPLNFRQAQMIFMSYRDGNQ